MRKIVVVILSIFVFVMGYLVYDVLTLNQRLKSEISDRSDLIYQNEIDKEAYELKKKELDEIKEKNKDKASKYDEVEAWNQEIIKYLD